MKILLFGGTGVRPTMTYNAHRLQLGRYEMENWLYRVLQDWPSLFFEGLMNVRTPMTYGDDAAWASTLLVGNPAVIGEVVQIATSKMMPWMETLQVYTDTLKSCRAGVLGNTVTASLAKHGNSTGKEMAA